MSQKMYTQIARVLCNMKKLEKRAWKGDMDCHALQESNNRFADILAELEEGLPHGSGFDSQARVNLDFIHSRRNDYMFTINGSYHCMNPDGYYCGWIHFVVTVGASLLYGVTIDVRPIGDWRYAMAEVLSCGTDLDDKPIEVKPRNVTLSDFNSYYGDHFAESYQYALTDTDAQVNWVTGEVKLSYGKENG